MMQISKDTARKFILTKQLLLPPKTLQGDKGIAHVFNTLRAIQYDPLNICGRNPDLVLQARINGTHPTSYYKWLYEERKGIECYDKELCIIPIEDFGKRKAYKFTPEGKRGQFITQHKKDITSLLSRIKKSGPISSQDITDSRKIDDFWGSKRWGNAALETLWRAEKLAISKRENGRKYYDLPEKLYKAEFLKTALTKTKLLETHIERRIKATGLLPASGTGSGWLGVGTGKEIAPTINKLIKNKILKEVKIETVNRKFVILKSDTQTLQKAGKQKITNKKMTFLAPLDNLLWDRKMINEIFNLDYKWEVYTPPKDRKFGYYVLPILYGDKFIGRIEPILKNDILEIKNLWTEPSFKWSNQSTKALNQAIKEFQIYLKAKGNLDHKKTQHIST